MKLGSWSSQQQVDSPSGDWEKTSSVKPETLWSSLHVDYIKRLEARAAPLDHFTLGTPMISVISSHSCSHTHKPLVVWVLYHMPMLFFCYSCSRSPSDFLLYVAPKEGSAHLTLGTFGCNSPLSQGYWDHQFCFSSREQVFIFRNLNRYSLRTFQTLLSTDHFIAGLRRGKTSSWLKVSSHHNAFLLHSTPGVKLGQGRKMV